MNGTVDVEAGVPRRLLDSRCSGEDDRVRHRQAAAKLVDLREQPAQLLRLVDRPILLRSEADARAIGAAAMVGLAIGRSRRPGRLDQLADAEASFEDLVLERRDIGIGRRRAGRDRVLPDQVFGGDFRAEVPHLRAHVAVGQLEPGAREGVLERFMVIAELLRDPAELGVLPKRHVGGRHHRRDALVGIVRCRRHVLVLLVDRLPLLRPRGRAHQLIFIVEQQPEIILRPFGRRIHPRPFDAAGDGVLAETALVSARPAKALERNVRAFGSRIDQARVARAVRLAERMAARRQRDRLLMVHRHALEGDLDVARRLQRVGIAARPFRIDVDEAHLDRRQRMLQLQLAVGLDARLGALADPFLLGAPVDVALSLEHVRAPAAESEDRTAHVLDRHVAGENEEVGPADVLPVLLLDRPKQAPRLVEIAVVRPAVERSEALLAAVRAAPPIGRAIGARRVPGHTDHERPVMPVVGRPPGLAVGHQRLEVVLQRLIVELLERLGIVEVVAHRVGRDAALMKDSSGRESGHQSRFCRPSSERTVLGRPQGSPSIRRFSRPSSSSPRSKREIR